MNPPPLTASALAALCGVTPAAVHVGRRRGTIPPNCYELIAGSYRYHFSAVEFVGKAHRLRRLSQKEVVELVAELTVNHPAAAEIVAKKAEWQKSYKARQPV